MVDFEEVKVGFNDVNLVDFGNDSSKVDDVVVNEFCYSDEDVFIIVNLRSGGGTKYIVMRKDVISVGLVNNFFIFFDGLDNIDMGSGGKYIFEGLCIMSGG